MQAGSFWPVDVEADVLILSLLSASLLWCCCNDKVLQGSEQKAVFQDCMIYSVPMPTVRCVEPLGSCNKLWAA